MNEFVMLYTTFTTFDEAENLGEDLVERHLAACINILPQMRSIYRWGGEFHNTDEVVMLVKTTAARAAEVIREIKRLHSADEPAILQLPITGGSESYLSWIRTMTA